MKVRRRIGSRYAVEHGLTGSPVFYVWCAMKQRCLNPRNPRYPRYGGRGIGICPYWLDALENFYADMGQPPSGRSIDRKDNNGGYWCGHCPDCLMEGHPANCQWGNSKQQNNNTCRSRLLTFKGKTQTAAQWSDESGISRSALYTRLSRGWTIERALSMSSSKTGWRHTSEAKAKISAAMKEHFR